MSYRKPLSLLLATLLGLAVCTGCSGDDGDSDTTPSSLPTGMPILTSTAPDGYEETGESPAPTGNEQMVVQYVTLANAEKGCTLQHQALLVDLSGQDSDQLGNDNANTKALMASTAAEAGFETANWDDTVRINAEFGPVKAVRADLSSEDQSARIQARMSMLTGQGVIIFMACGKDAFDEDGWTQDLNNLQIGNFAGTEW